MSKQQKLARGMAAPIATWTWNDIDWKANGDAKPSRRTAIKRAKPIRIAPSADSIRTIVTELVQLQKMRKFSIRSQSRCNGSIESLIASVIGFRLDDDERTRKSVFARAKAYRLRVEDGGEGQNQDETQSAVALSAITPAILKSAAARQPWDDERWTVEKEMERLAKQLPIYPFVASVRGLGAKGFAVLVAEAGIPLGDYRTVSGLWKRLGLAVIRGECQRKKTNKEAAAEHGYSPGRRAEVWSICSYSLFLAQWRGADEEVGIPARPIGPYGEVYAKRRLHTAQRVIETENLSFSDPTKWTEARSHNDACRVMTKRLMLDLYLAWRGETFIPLRCDATP